MLKKQRLLNFFVSGRRALSVLLGLLFLCSHPVSVSAEDGPAEIKSGESRYIYEKPSRQKFSRLYWALGMLDLKNDTYIDDFLQINECDIYKDYYYNEFEWKSVRESGRKFLAENSNKFPLRFEVAQPLFLGEYDLHNKSFDILSDYQIKETTRIEVFPQDYADVVCINDGSGRVVQLDGYPIGIVAEFNRPLNLINIPVPEALARAYIDEKMKGFKELDTNKQTQENLYSFRDAYLFLHMKFFAYKSQYTSRENYRLAVILAVLEGFEIYADRDKKMLLWSQDFRKKKIRPANQPALIKNELDDKEVPPPQTAEKPENKGLMPSADFNPASPPGTTTTVPGAVAPFESGETGGAQ